MRWIPIETAPRDGSMFDVWAVAAPDHQYRIPDVRYVYGQGFLKNYTRPIGEKLTHWMPRPEAPVGQG